jgi:hypothetical protein
VSGSTYVSGDNRCLDCPACGQAARVDLHSDRLRLQSLDGGSQEKQKESREKPSRATVLVGLALSEGAELFRTPEGEAFATVPIDGRRQTWPLKTKTIRRWLARLFYEHTEEAPGSQAIQDALGVLEGKALFDGVEHPVHVRTAEHDGRIYLDLADPEWRAVAIAPGSGWEVVPNPPAVQARPRDAGAADTRRRGFA